MEKKTNIGLMIVGAAAAYALYKFYSMPREDRDELVKTIKDKTKNLLEDAEHTVEKVEHYVEQIKARGKEEWIDKIYLVKKMFADLYITDQNLISRIE